MFKKILVPLDGSALAEQALVLAATIAARSVGLTSIEVLLVDTNALRAPTASEGDAFERIYVHGIAEEVSRLHGVSATGIVVPGDPVAVIAERAKVTGADLIVMTTHGRTGFARAVLGSVADGVVRSAGRPVLIQRPSKNYHWRTAVATGFKRILVALDGTDDATRVVAPVLELCREMEARPILACVVHPVVDISFSEAGVAFYGPEDEMATRHLVDRAQEELTSIALDIETDTGIPVETSANVGNEVATTLLETAERARADLIALTTHRRGISRLVASSVADKLLSQSELPLLLLHPQAVAQRDDDASLAAARA